VKNKTKLKNLSRYLIDELPDNEEELVPYHLGLVAPMK